MKKIKIIDLLNMISKGEEVPKKIDYEGKIFEYDELEKCYVTSNFDNTVMQGLDLYIDGLKQYCLNLEVEIIEEEPEIDIQNIQEYTKDELEYMCPEDLKPLAYKSNELIKAVKQLDRQINNK